MKTILLLLALAACSVHDKTFADGAFGGACFPNGTCDTGLSCEEDYCVMPPDGGHVGLHDPDAGVDAPTSYQCADDSIYEVNDDFAHAYHTEVDVETTDKTFSGLAICPPSDLDYYLIQITSPGQILNVYVTYDANGSALQLELYNASHAVIVNGSASSPFTLHAQFVGAPVGSYYAFVRSDGAHESNYSLSISVSQ